MEAYWHYILGEPENYSAPVIRYDELAFVQDAVWALKNLTAEPRELERRFPCDIPRQWNRCASRFDRQRERVPLDAAGAARAPSRVLQ